MNKKELEKIFKKEYTKKVTNELPTETLIDAAIKFITDNIRPSVIGHRFCEFYEHTACLTCSTLDPDGHVCSVEFSFIEVLNLIRNRFEESINDLEILDLMIKKGIDISKIRSGYGIESYNADSCGHQNLDDEEYNNIKKLIFKYEGRTNYANRKKKI